ncbi:uncharacterized protein N7487_004828 [Penicillium crustosum]|uniref:uncharacterized protein n=1 Tax=Penicillium crustosum TaxID=36656 RepID=UPI002386C8D7|nr:uncharacterized protein N7487_004828 [Penicillium crustosum]KAJ5410469.1 hypothetical protein N7487_004828 [Penicillium crustosum]
MLSTYTFCSRLPTSPGYIYPHLTSYPISIHSRGRTASSHTTRIAKRIYTPQRIANHTTSIIGLVVEFVVAIDEARVRFTDDAQQFLFCNFFC